MPTTLITGAASGIGLALAKHFAGAGHRVIACDLQREPLDSLRSELPGIRTLAFDVSDARQIDEAFANLGGDSPDVLINNAGLQYVAPLEEFPADKWQQLISVMLTGAALLTRAALPSMRLRN